MRFPPGTVTLLFTDVDADGIARLMIELAD
jgi:hypothetical protein